ncbi:aminotransferase class V-fold PLP-dependent enzyme [Aeromonas schubertii]|uniref:aminotransferase class V-fold PLP-dependent enzyme n=1 Tax=Aeromonas schubertii TaxID=652 RepID=UPI001CC6933D|nr:cysteine desulfurase [Aeromonas schubertii]MBZ6072690.1 cysteine desulfurase [Aeromonas schubertii]
MSLCVSTLRRQFPALHQLVNGHPLVYLDNAATTQKPEAVLEAMRAFYQNDNANVHRASHALSTRATAAFEAARETVARFINAPDSREVIWTRGTTEAINLVAQSWGQSLKPGDEILVSTLEHHANIVPWQLAAQRSGARVVPIPLDPHGDIDLDAYQALLGPRTRLVAVSQVSNALGTINPVAEMARLAKAAGALVLIDGAQAVAHLPVDVQRLGCDFYAFSGHKMYAPTGIGALWGRRELLEKMPPWQGGGEMIERVSFSGTTFNRPPFKFEAGTPHIAGAVSLAAAIDFLQEQERDALLAHEYELTTYLAERLRTTPGVRLVGEPKERIGAVSFLLDEVHPQDAGTLLDLQGVAVRVGHHCAMPLMESLGIGGTLRASLACYSTREEVDALIRAIHKLEEFF